MTGQPRLRPQAGAARLNRATWRVRRISGSPAGRKFTRGQPAFTRLRLETLAAERAVYVSARDSGEINDDVLRRVLRELDLEQARLVSRD